MSESTDGIVQDIERAIRAGLAEFAGEARAEFEPFVRDFAVHAADVAMRAEMGSAAARISLRMLKEQALTHAYIAQVTAAGVTLEQVGTVIGWVARLLLGVL